MVSHFRMRMRMRIFENLVAVPILSYIVNVNRSFKLAHFTRLRLLNAAVSATTGTAAPNLAGRTGPKSSGNGGGPVKPSKKNRASKLARLRSMSCFKCSIYKDSLQSVRDKVTDAKYLLKKRLKSDHRSSSNITYVQTPEGTNRNLLANLFHWPTPNVDPAHDTASPLLSSPSPAHQH